MKKKKQKFKRAAAWTLALIMILSILGSTAIMFVMYSPMPQIIYQDPEENIELDEEQKGDTETSDSLETNNVE